MPGSGINPETIAAVAAATGASEFHAALRTEFPSPVRYRKEGVTMGDIPDREYLRFAVAGGQGSRFAGRSGEPGAQPSAATSTDPPHRRINRMAYFLGVDSGGTKAEFVLGDETRELARVRTGTIKRLKVDAADGRSESAGRIAATAVRNRHFAAPGEPLLHRNRGRNRAAGR